MGLLTFRDADGVPWRVWYVETPAARAHLMDVSYRNGWLVFEKEDGTERRRLNQVPEDWSHLAPEHLARLCALAVVAPPSRTTSSVTTVRMPITPRSSDSRSER